MILSGNREVSAPYIAPSKTKTVESLRRGNFVNQVEIDVDEIRRTIFTFDD